MESGLKGKYKINRIENMHKFITIMKSILSIQKSKLNDVFYIEMLNEIQLPHDFHTN